MFRRGYGILPHAYSQMRSIATLRKLRRPIELAVGSYFYFRILKPQASDDKDLQVVKRVSDESLSIPSESTLLQRVYRSLATFLRFLQLIAIFSPSIILLPLSLFEFTENIWYNVFVKTIEMAGVVWMKGFQYLSHRRDIIGDKMADKFMHLRERAPEHNFDETARCFEREFGKGVHQIFDSFKKEPIASGSISQVYEAVYRGEKVAVKVRHPNIGANIARDIDIMFGVSNALSYLWHGFELPITKSTLKKTLTDQLDFRIQIQNLKTFNELFILHKDVHFPEPYEVASGSSILVQTFEQGKPITYYEHHPHTLNKTIARIGGLTFFEMLMKYNFIHADCHGGNIMVRISEKKFTKLDYCWDLLYRAFRSVERVLVKLSSQSKIAKELYLQSRRQEDQAREIQQSLNLKVQIILIDVGLVIELEERDRKNFVNFIRCIIEKEPQQCARMIYSLSIKKGRPIIEGGIKYIQYFNKLKVLFEELTSIDLRELQGLELLRGMLSIIRDYGMKLDGQLGTLITNMLILQQIAKDLYPKMNILGCAVPYFYIPQI